MKGLIVLAALMGTTYGAYTISLPGAFVSVQGVNCTAATGYRIWQALDAAGCGATATVGFGLQLQPVIAAGTCGIVTGIAVPALYFIACDFGYTPFTNTATYRLASGLAADGFVQSRDAAGAVQAIATAACVPANYVGLAAADSTAQFSVPGANAAAMGATAAAAALWTCSPVNCVVTCSTPTGGTAGGCKAATFTTAFGGAVVVASSTSSLTFCNTYFVDTSATLIAAGTTCGGVRGTNYTVNCDGGVSGLTGCASCTVAQEAAWIRLFPANVGPLFGARQAAWSTQLMCLLTALPNDVNGNGYIRGPNCFIGMIPSVPFVNAWDRYYTWFRTLACYNGGAIQLNDAGLVACRFFPGGFAAVFGAPLPAFFISTDCPRCDSGSKKGLLGLLGLLGIIPLLLISCLLCLCLLCIRRKKTEGDVHFATFDAGAPVCAEVPVPMHHATVHTATHVGAPMFGAPCVY